jgi:hypothetical protein
MVSIVSLRGDESSLEGMHRDLVREKLVREDECTHANGSKPML